MQRIKDDFIKTLTRFVPLTGKMVLEVGCGTGYYSEQIARECKGLTAIDPDRSMLSIARCLDIPNALFFDRSAVATRFTSGRFDATVATLSFHHIERSLMPQALDEAVRVTHPAGRIVAFEPATRGSFFEAEILFDACDGDERKAKDDALRALHSHPRLRSLISLGDQTVFKFDDVEDFKRSMAPRVPGRTLKNTDRLEGFLRAHDYTLMASRSIEIFSIRA